MIGVGPCLHRESTNSYSKPINKQDMYSFCCKFQHTSGRGGGREKGGWMEGWREGERNGGVFVCVLVLLHILLYYKQE